MTKTRTDDHGNVLRMFEYQRPNGTYEFRYHDFTGKRLSAYAATLDDLHIREWQVLRDLADGIVVNTPLTLNQLYEKWLGLKRGLKDNTLQHYKYMFETYVRSELGTRKLSGLKPSDIRSFYNHLYEERKLSIHSIDNIQTVLHQVLALAVEDDHLRKNPSDHALKELKRLAVKKKRKGLTPEEQLRQAKADGFLLRGLSCSGRRRWRPARRGRTARPE